jgi:hypothetical protein
MVQAMEAEALATQIVEEGAPSDGNLIAASLRGLFSCVRQGTTRNSGAIRIALSSFEWVFFHSAAR